MNRIGTDASNGSEDEMIPARAPSRRGRPSLGRRTQNRKWIDSCFLLFELCFFCRSSTLEMDRIRDICLCIKKKTETYLYVLRVKKHGHPAEKEGEVEGGSEEGLREGSCLGGALTIFLEPNQQRRHPPRNKGWGLACTRYSFTLRLLSTNQPCFIPRAHLHCPPWCNIIARLLDGVRLPFRPPVSMLYTIQYW